MINKGRIDLVLDTPVYHYVRPFLKHISLQIFLRAIPHTYILTAHFRGSSRSSNICGNHFRNTTFPNEENMLSIRNDEYGYRLYWMRDYGELVWFKYVYKEG